MPITLTPEGPSQQVADPNQLGSFQIAGLTDGGYVVTWFDFDRRVVKARLVGPDGTPEGPEFDVSSAGKVAGDLEVTGLANGNFVVAWQDFFSNTALVQLFDATGSRIGNPFDPSTREELSGAELAARQDGGFYAFWQDQLGSLGRRYDPAGHPVGQAFATPFVGQAAVLASGNIAIMSIDSVQLLDAAGNPVGQRHELPFGGWEVTALAGGGFVVVGTSFRKDGDISAQVFDASGNPIDTPFIVHPELGGQQSQPSLAALSDGGFAISWSDDNGTGDARIQVFDAFGIPARGPIVLADSPVVPQLTTLASGELVAVWDNGTELRAVKLAETALPTTDGTAGNDLLLGTAADDNLQGLGGNDNIQGGGGADDLRGGAGDDYLNGGAGANIMDGGAGRDGLDGGSAIDRLFGGEGDDILLGNGGNDWLRGGPGADRVVGGDGNDELDGGFGNDTLSGGAGNDRLDGATGADYMDGGAGDDTYLADDSSDAAIEAAGGGFDTVVTAVSGYALRPNVERLIYTGSTSANLVGNESDNQISAGFGDDFIRGRGGNDVIEDRSGNNQLYGEGGNDKITGSGLLDGGAGDDVLWGLGRDPVLRGGEGNDLLRSSPVTTLGLVVLDGGAGTDRMEGDGGENIYYVDDRGDVIVEKGTGFDRVVSTASYYELAAGVEFYEFTGPGFASLVGTAGDDWIILVAPNGMSLRAGDGADLLSGSAGADVIAGEGGNDRLFGNGDKDSLNGGDGDDDLFGDAGDDLVVGGSGNDDLEGGIGADRLVGGDGADELTGGLGADILNGGEGNDLLRGEDGRDYLDGGAGADTFSMGIGFFGEDPDPAGDTIVNFSRSEGDRIDLHQIDADTSTQFANEAFNYIGSSAFSGTAGELRVVDGGGRFKVEGDVNGDGVADLTLYVTTTGTPLGAADFVL